MSLLAACNLLRDEAIQKLFHSEAAVSATELLLHEKLSLSVQPTERINGAALAGEPSEPGLRGWLGIRRKLPPRVRTELGREKASFGAN
jgi:hypothetical protein